MHRPRSGQVLATKPLTFIGAPSTGDYCLFAEGEHRLLYTAGGAGAPPFQYEFVGEQSQQF